VPSKTILPEGYKPEQGLEDHQPTEEREKTAHNPHPVRIRPTEIVVAVRRGDQPSERIRLGLHGRFVIQLGIEVWRVYREAKLPVGQQHRGDDETEHQGNERRPAEAVRALRLDRRRAEESRNKSVGREERARALADSCNDSVLICERVATGLEHDFLKPGHIPERMQCGGREMSR
jgi:hypothetical protein